MINIFVYGSLMFDPVWKRIISTDYKKCDAFLQGYQRLNIKDEVYPGLVRASNQTVAGQLIFNICSTDLQRLDQFEGEYYQRTVVSVSDHLRQEHQAAVYLFNKQYSHLLLNTEWDQNMFLTRDMQTFLSDYNGF